MAVWSGVSLSCSSDEYDESIVKNILLAIILCHVAAVGAQPQTVVTFCNNGRRNQLSVEAEGIAGDGRILTGKR